jgi:hypothetical protein
MEQLPTNLIPGQFLGDEPSSVVDCRLVGVWRRSILRCVAGKEIGGGKIGPWIRPIRGRPTGELSEEDRRFENGQARKLLDVVSIPMIEPAASRLPDRPETI